MFTAEDGAVWRYDESRGDYVKNSDGSMVRA